MIESQPPCVTTTPESRELLKKSESHGGGALVKPLLPSPTAARVLARVLDGLAPDEDVQGALNRLREENRALLDPDADNARILYGLAEQMQILEAIFLRYTAEGMRDGPADRRAALHKVAFNAQAAYVRAAAVLVTARRSNAIPSTT